MVKTRKVLEEVVRTHPGEFHQRIGRIMRLDRNERTTPFDPEVVRTVLGSIDPELIAAYPELEPVYERIAQSLGVDRENVLLFSGSDPGIKSLFEVYVEPADEVMTLTPSYGMFFVYSRMYGATLVPVPYQPDFCLPVESLIGKITDQTKLVLIANPNHTGTAIAMADLRSILAAAATHEALVLVDEAYYEFHGESVVGMISEYDNLVVSRTMSKAYGIPGLRVGYLVSDSRNIENLGKVRATHEITALSAQFAEHLLDHPEVLERNVAEINGGKSLIHKRGLEMGIECLPSVTNFVFLKLPEHVDGKAVVDALKVKNIYIAGPFNEVPLVGLIRVTVGPPAQMEEFMGALAEVMKGL